MNDSFRIRYPQENNGGKAAFNTQANSRKSKNDYLERLVKLIPAEVIGIYLTIRNAAADDNGDINIVEDYPWLPITGLILVIIVRIYGSRVPVKVEKKGEIIEKTDIEWGMVLISSISFFIWLYAIGDQFPKMEWLNDKVLITALVSIWTFSVPYFYRPQQSKTTNT